MKLLLCPLLFFGMISLASRAYADRLELQDGTVIEGCYVRDEGIRLLVWESLEAVGGPAKIYPRSAVKEYKIERDDAWDVHPNLPDLSVIFIEINPKLPGLHGVVHYDKFGRPRLGGAAALKEIGDRAYEAPEEVVGDLPLQYEPGQRITLTANVRNVGFATAQPFGYVWLIDSVEVARGQHDAPLEEMEIATFDLEWAWQEGFHHVTFRIETDQPEIATINNEATDPLWGWGLVFITHPKRVELWHQYRTAYGTFSFEDFYRWHIEIMNRLFEASVYPAAPEGIRARVRLDRIVYAEDVEAEANREVRPNGLRYDQGRWIWIDDGDRKGAWQPPTKEWRNQTEWSLPHELGHQLGLTDLYRLDYPGHEEHVMPDTGEPVTHFMNHPLTMMHWHGPHLWSEVDAGYLNQTWDKPRGHYGDYYFATPRENLLHVVDINGRGVPGAQVAIFQRGVVVDPNGTPMDDQGVTVFPVIEDGNFDHPVSKDPVILGQTDAQGWMRLPNRPVAEVRTLNGFERRANPFGNLDVVGQRGLLLVRVTREGRSCYFWLEIVDFNVAWFRGQRDRFVVRLQTPYGSEDSPPPPQAVRVVEGEVENRVRVVWDPPKIHHEQHPLERVIGYRVYRRIGNDGLNDRPWFPVATVSPDTHAVDVDLTEFPQDVYWYSKVNRFAVSSIGALDLESELVEVVWK